jgi:hypothetical protein
VELQTGGVSGLSIQQEGSFFGFSIEFSVTTQVREYFHLHVLPLSLNTSCSRAEQVTNSLPKWTMIFTMIGSSFLQVPFLNLMANLRQRGGSVKVRVGGNTQETATLVASTPDGAALEKDYGRVSNPVSAFFLKKQLS